MSRRGGRRRRSLRRKDDRIALLTFDIWNGNRFWINGLLVGKKINQGIVMTYLQQRHVCQTYHVTVSSALGFTDPFLNRGGHP